MKCKLLILGLLLFAGSGYATFQNWQSDAFEEKSPRKEVKERPNNEALELEREIREDPSINEESYYEAIAPKDMERDHNYLLENHPLQEDPLPTKGVE